VIVNSGRPVAATNDESTMRRVKGQTRNGDFYTKFKSFSICFEIPDFENAMVVGSHHLTEGMIVTDRVYRIIVRYRD